MHCRTLTILPIHQKHNTAHSTDQARVGQSVLSTTPQCHTALAAFRHYTGKEDDWLGYRLSSALRRPLLLKQTQKKMAQRSGKRCPKIFAK